MRTDDSSIHRAVREALVNCLTNADFYVRRGIVITVSTEKIVFENPGYIRCGKEQMIKGGISDPRNKIIMKMFNIIGVGERAGSGVPDIFNTWTENGFIEPRVSEEFSPDRTILELNFRKIIANERLPETRKNHKTREFSDARARKTYEKIKDKTARNIFLIKYYLKCNGESDVSSISEYVGLSSSRLREILSKMENVECVGKNKNRKYRLKIK